MKLDKLNNVTSVSTVKKLLPTNIKWEWALDQKLDPRIPVFPKLVEFLVKEQKVLNYIDNDSFWHEIKRHQCTIFRQKKPM